MALDLVQRNVVELVEVPRGKREGRRSKLLTPEQSDQLLIRTSSDRMHAYIVLSLLSGGRTEELRELRWEHVHLERTSVDDEKIGRTTKWRSVRRGGDTKTRRSRRTLALPQRCVDALPNAAPSRIVTGCLPDISGTIPVWSLRRTSDRERMPRTCAAISGMR